MSHEAFQETTPDGVNIIKSGYQTKLFTKLYIPLKLSEICDGEKLLFAMKDPDDVNSKVFI